MTHDPLCPVGVKPWEDYYCCQKCSPGETPPWERACQCDLIAKVRADQRECCVAVIEEVAKDTSDPQLLIAAILEKS